MQTDVSGVDQILRKVTAEEGYVAGLCSGAIGMVDMDVDGGRSIWKMSKSLMNIRRQTPVSAVS